MQRDTLRGQPEAKEVVYGMRDLSSTTNRPPCARPTPTFSTVEEAHTGLIERLGGAKPRRILYIADAQDIEERAEHLQPVLGAMLDYVGAIVTDTDYIAPGIDRPEIPPGLDLRCG